MSQLVFSMHDWNPQEIGSNTSEAVNLPVRARASKAKVSFFHGFYKSVVQIWSVFQPQVIWI